MYKLEKEKNNYKINFKKNSFADLLLIGSFNYSNSSSSFSRDWFENINS